MLLVVDASTNTAVPIAVGAIIAGAGSLIFIMRTHAFDQEEQAGNTKIRQRSVRSVLVIYAIITWLCLVAAVAIGDVAFIATTGLMALLSTIALVVLWSRPRGW